MPAEITSPTSVTSTQSEPPTWADEFTANLNHGWFYIIPTNPKILYAHLENDSLILKLPNGKERKDVMAYSPKLAEKNFVLNFDFKFGKSEPNDIFRIQFKQSTNQTILVDLSKSEDSIIRWSLYNESQTSSGTYVYFGPQYVNVTIILKGNQCAVYFNNDPFAYLNDCRTEPIPEPIKETVSFHLISTTGHPAIVTVDNIKFWNLDKPLYRP